MRFFFNFCNPLFNIYGSWLAVGNYSQGKWNHGLGNWFIHVMYVPEINTKWSLGKKNSRTWLYHSYHIVHIVGVADCSCVLTNSWWVIKSQVRKSSLMITTESNFERVQKVFSSKVFCTCIISILKRNENHFQCKYSKKRDL